MNSTLRAEREHTAARIPLTPLDKLTRFVEGRGARDTSKRRFPSQDRDLQTRPVRRRLELLDEKEVSKLAQLTEENADLKEQLAALKEENYKLKQDLLEEKISKEKLHEQVRTFETDSIGLRSKKFEHNSSRIRVLTGLRSGLS